MKKGWIGSAPFFWLLRAALRLWIVLCSYGIGWFVVAFRIPLEFERTLGEGGLFSFLARVLDRLKYLLVLLAVDIF